MAIKVAGGLKDVLLGQLYEIERQIRQTNGYGFDPLQLKFHLQAGIEGRFRQVFGSFRFEKREDGWTLLENVPRRLTSSNIEAVSFLKRLETYINGEALVSRALQMEANYGQEDAEWLLENQNQIPAELRKFYLVFPGTIWQGAHGPRGVPYLDWRGGRWVLDFFWLDRGWGSHDRLVRPRK